MASLYKRANTPYWYVQLTPKERLLLNRSNFSTGIKNRKEADLILRQVKKDIQAAKLTPPEYRSRTNNDIHFNEAFEMFKLDRKNEGKQLSDLTLDIYKQALLYFDKFCRRVPVQHYTRKDYHAYIAALDENNCGQNTKAIYTARIYAVFNFLKREGIIDNNPWRTVSETNNQIKIKTDAEIKELLEYARDKKFYNPVKFMILSAFRASEACNLRKKDIDLANNVIHVTGKGNKTESIPVIREMESFLNSLDLAKLKNDDKVFNTHYDAIRYFLYRAEKKTGIKFETHDFRKYCLSKLANSGVNIYFVKEYARHSNIKTTLQYYTQADKKKQAAEINEKVKFDLL